MGMVVDRLLAERSAKDQLIGELRRQVAELEKLVPVAEGSPEQKVADTEQTGDASAVTEQVDVCVHG